MTRLERAGLVRGAAIPWPEAEAPDEPFLRAWSQAWGDAPLPHLLWLTHPSAQNMSPFAGTETSFHARMVETRDALRRAVQDVLGWEVPEERPAPPETGIYALPEWRERIGPRHAARRTLARQGRMSAGTVARKCVPPYTCTLWCTTLASRSAN